MRLALTSAAWIGLAAVTGAVPALAQMQDNNEKQLSCQNGGYSDQARHCEMREQSVASIGKLTVDSGPNGGASIKGWTRGDVLVRARVEAQADTDSAAASLVSQVLVESSGGMVKATGPETKNRNGGWSVSYEIFVPHGTDLELKTVNGGMNISDVRGQIHFDVVNGGVHLKRVGGDIQGKTVNGGIQVELAGTVFDGRQMEIGTQNGGVTLSVPSYYSAHLQAETGSGSIQSDFPLQMDGSTRPHKVDSVLGGGGALIHITTGNGSVHVKKTETN